MCRHEDRNAKVQEIPRRRKAFWASAAAVHRGVRGRASVPEHRSKFGAGEQGVREASRDAAGTRVYLSIPIRCAPRRNSAAPSGWCT